MYRIALAAGLITLASASAAQSYPSKPVRIIVMYTAGSTIDIMARLIAPKLTEALGQAVIMENKGNGESITDLIGGQISMVFTGSKRIAAIPDLPTIAEAGYPGATVGIWYGLAAPAATPKDILTRLHKEITRIQTLPDVRERFAQLGTESTTSSPEAFTALVREELAKWGKVIKAAGVKVE